MAFEMNGLRRILWVSWTAKKTNECMGLGESGSNMIFAASG